MLTQGATAPAQGQKPRWPHHVLSTMQELQFDDNAGNFEGLPFNHPQASVIYNLSVHLDLTGYLFSSFGLADGT